jgi:hypothetical protein
MSTGKIIGYIIGGLALLGAIALIGFGIIYVMASTDPNTGLSSWRTAGIILSCVGLIVGAGGVGIILYTIRRSGDDKPAPPPEQKVTLEIDLSGDVSLEQFKCENCGGALSPDNVSMIAGAPTVNCPYCGATYQITEEPKW